MTGDYLHALSLLFRNGPYFLGGTHGRQASILQHLVMSGVIGALKETKASIRVVEVGSWIGFSALTWAHAIDQFARDGGEVVCVDTWEPYFADADMHRGPIYADMTELSRIGLSFDLFRHNCSFAPKRAPIRFIRGRSQEVLASLTPGSADVVYIDGSHYYNDVRADLATAIPLVSVGGVLCGDDLELQIPDIEVDDARAVIGADFCPDPTSGRSFHPGVTLAVHEALGWVPAVDGFWYVRRTETGWDSFDPTRGDVFVPPHFTPDMRRQALDIIRRSA
jgi:predicted O-methyltransferase YrrM